MNAAVSNWLNFSEAGPWAWLWHRIQSGCARRHEWSKGEEWESWDEGAAFHVSTYRECGRCGAWEELWHYLDDAAAPSPEASHGDSVSAAVSGGHPKDPASVSPVSPPVEEPQ